MGSRKSLDVDTGVQAKIEKMRAAAAQLMEKQQYSSEQLHGFPSTSWASYGRGLHCDPGGSGQVGVTEYEEQDLF